MTLLHCQLVRQLQKITRHRAPSTEEGNDCMSVFEGLSVQVRKNWTQDPYELWILWLLPVVLAAACYIWSFSWVDPGRKPIFVALWFELTWLFQLVHRVTMENIWHRRWWLKFGRSSAWRHIVKVPWRSDGGRYASNTNSSLRFLGESICHMCLWEAKRSATGSQLQWMLQTKNMARSASTPWWSSVMPLATPSCSISPYLAYHLLNIHQGLFLSVLQSSNSPPDFLYPPSPPAAR